MLVCFFLLGRSVIYASYSPWLSAWWTKQVNSKREKPKPERLAKLDRALGAFMSTHTAAIIFAVFFLILYLAASAFGGASANGNIENPRNSVRIAFKDPQTQKANTDLIQSSDSGNLSFVVQTKDLVVLFDRAAGSTALRNTYILNRSDLAFFQISNFRGKK
jgi:hypothetical protein